MCRCRLTRIHYYDSVNQKNVASLRSEQYILMFGITHKCFVLNAKVVHTNV
jgi:hypothetical protein